MAEPRHIRIIDRALLHTLCGAEVATEDFAYRDAVAAARRGELNDVCPTCKHCIEDTIRGVRRG